jgi:hypothetical protein
MRYSECENVTYASKLEASRFESIAFNPARDLLASYERGVADAMGDSLFIQDKLKQFGAAGTISAKTASISTTSIGSDDSFSFPRDEILSRRTTLSLSS